MSPAAPAGRHRAPRRLRSRRAVAGAALAGAALALPGWFVALPAAADALGADPAAAPSPMVAQVAGPESEADAVAPLPRPARDPFAPLVGPDTEPAALADPATAVAVAGATAGLPAPPPPPPPAEPTAAEAALPAAPETLDAGRGSVSDSDDAVLVRLLDAYSRDGGGRVRLALDGVVVDLALGEVFADVLRVTAVAEPCASFAAGTETFTLCEGEERPVAPPPPPAGASVSTR